MGIDLFIFGVVVFLLEYRTMWTSQTTMQ